MSTSFQSPRGVIVDSELPAQGPSTNGKALISNGMTANWNNILGMIGTNPGQVTSTQFLNSILPTQTGNANTVLWSDGFNTSWVSGYASTTYVQNSIQTTGQNSQGSKTVSTSTPFGTATPGDVWYVV